MDICIPIFSPLLAHSTGEVTEASIIGSQALPECHPQKDSRLFLSRDSYRE